MGHNLSISNSLPPFNFSWAIKRENYSRWKNLQCINNWQKYSINTMSNSTLDIMVICMKEKQISLYLPLLGSQRKGNVSEGLGG